MRVVVQRSGPANVVVDKKIVGKIPEGMMVLVGFTDGDKEEVLDKMARKIVNLRIYPDDNGVMNKSILEYGGEVLLVSQFTLYASTSKGNRPSYTMALGHQKAEDLYDKFVQVLKKYIKVETGVFGADMEVNFTNIGPSTFIIEM